VVALPRIIAKRWPGAGVDVLVNNAGMARNNAGLWDGATASWVEMVSTNVLGVCMCTREALQARAPTLPCLTWRPGCVVLLRGGGLSAWCAQRVMHRGGCMWTVA
jgi:NAD(P)-dependent dehydrogenase (short-subunit alcohol dehydrogenase family)